MKTIVFDGDADVYSIYSLNVTSITNQSISLSWQYNGHADGFNVTIFVEPPYPKMAPRTTPTNSILIDNLAPGAKYIFSVSFLDLQHLTLTFSDIPLHPRISLNIPGYLRTPTDISCTVHTSSVV